MKQKSNAYKLTYAIVSFIIATFFNVYTSTFLSERAKHLEIFVPGINLNYLENTGAAFSILQDSKIFLISFSIFALGLILVYLIKNIKELRLLPIFFITILMSGITCNLIERISYGYVRDYFEIVNLNFPVFNISDIFINISVVIIMILLLRGKL